MHAYQLVITTTVNTATITACLLLGNAHSVLDVGKDGRLNEISLVTDTITTDAQLSTFLLSTVNQLHDLRRLICVDLPSHTATIHITNKDALCNSIGDVVRTWVNIHKHKLQFYRTVTFSIRQNMNIRLFQQPNSNSNNNY